MPAIVAIAVRYIIQAAITLGISALLEKYGLPLINSAIKSVSEFFGATEEQAQAIVGNEVLKAAEEVGIFALAIRTKLPFKVAEALGFTTKGFVKRALPEAIEKLLPKSLVSSTAKKIATQVEAEAIAPVVAKSSGWAIKSVGDLLKYVTLVVGTPVGAFYAFAQYMDYGAWQNPYQKFFQGLLSYIGIHPDTALPSAKVISSDTWKRIYATIEQLKPQGLGFPVSGTIKPYTRENLAALVDEIAATIVKDGGDATYKNVIGILIPLIQLGGKEPKIPSFGATIDAQLNGAGSFMINQPFGTSSTTTTSPVKKSPVASVAGTLFDYFASLGQSLPSVKERSTIYEALGLGPAAYYTGTAEQNARLLAALKNSGNTGPVKTVSVVSYRDNPDGTTTEYYSDGTSGTVRYTQNADGSLTATEVVQQPTQVFTGVVSGGVLRDSSKFVPRPSDLISNMAGLENAAYNNIAAFLRNLAGLVTYEVKVVSSVLDADGVRQTGSTQKVVVGKNKNGTPKYKTVTNKFAEVILYILTQTGTRAKIATIVLGPVDVTSFSPNANDLVALSSRIQGNVITTDAPPSLVQTAPAQLVIQSDVVAVPTAPAAPIVPTSYPLPLDTSRTVSFLTDDGRGSSDPDAIVGGAPLRYSDTREPFAPSSTHKTITPEQKAASDAAPTLSDYFAAIGQSLPSLSYRASLYRWYNLGSVRNYTGTTDQNNALLSVLKSL